MILGVLDTSDRCSFTPYTLFQNKVVKQNHFVATCSLNLLRLHEIARDCTRSHDIEISNEKGFRYVLFMHQATFLPGDMSWLREKVTFQNAGARWVAPPLQAFVP